MFSNKKAQGLSTNTIILLILGVIVLIVLVLGFTVGWGKIAPFLSGDNVDAIANSCEVSCSTTSTFGFCFQSRDLKAGDTELKGVTCNYLAETQSKYGVSNCPAVTCEVSIVDSLENICDNPENQGKTFQALVGNTLESVDC